MLLVLFLLDKCRLYYCESFIGNDSLRIDGETYEEEEDSKNNSGFIGFFDWLRKTESEIVGIRMCFFEFLKYNDLLKKYSYIHPGDADRWVEMMFNGGEYNPDLSGDQDFAYNHMYKSKKGNYLLTCILDHLTEEELKNLLMKCKVLNENDIRGC